jgi:hypothetical protein
MDDEAQTRKIMELYDLVAQRPWTTWYQVEGCARAALRSASYGF